MSPTRRTQLRPRPKPRAADATVERLVPLHYEVYMTLRRRLLEGEYAAGSALPSENGLAAELGVSRVTIRRTLKRLEDEKLVERKHGIGTFPGEVAIRAAAAPALGSLRERLVGPDIERRSLRVLRLDRVPTPRELRRASAPSAELVLRLQRLSLHGARPAHLATSYVPLEHATAIRRDSIGNLTVLELLERSGVRIGDAEVSITAVAADAAAARLLEVPVGAPLLLVQRLTRDATGAPIEFFVGISRPDEYVFQFTTAHGSHGGRPLPWRGPA